MTRRLSGWRIGDFLTGLRRRGLLRAGRRGLLRTGRTGERLGDRDRRGGVRCRRRGDLTGERRRGGDALLSSFLIDLRGLRLLSLSLRSFSRSTRRSRSFFFKVS